MKKINAKKILLGGLLTLLVTGSVGCVVAERPYYYDSYRRYDQVRPYDRFWWYYWNRERARWYRDHDRWDRD